MPPPRSRPAACSASPDAPVTTAGAARARRWRLALIAGVALALAPGTFVRTATGRRTDVAAVTVTPLAERAGVTGQLPQTGVWALASPQGWFGGFSALVHSTGKDGEAALVAGTDRGFLLDIDLASGTPRARPRSFRFIGLSKGSRHEIVDLESLARDPATGTLWGGFEKYNLVLRWDADGTVKRAAPPAMADWAQNSGPEAMTRLADGRFLVIAEEAEDGSRTAHKALLFPGDPLARGRPPLALRFAAPADYDPVDVTGLPDGRVLILLRRVEYALPARFDTAIAIADPRAITAGGTWQGRVIQRMTGGIFADNFEGLAFVPSATDPARGSIWVISDDNMSIFQRSLLLRFDWPG